MKILDLYNIPKARYFYQNLNSSLNHHYNFGKCSVQTQCNYDVWICVWYYKVLISISNDGFRSMILHGLLLKKKSNKGTGNVISYKVLIPKEMKDINKNSWVLLNCLFLFSPHYRLLPLFSNMLYSTSQNTNQKCYIGSEICGEL